MFIKLEQIETYKTISKTKIKLKKFIEMKITHFNYRGHL